MPEATGLANGLAVVKAHPVVLGIVVVVAIDVIAYQLFKPSKEKKVSYSSARSTSTGHHESSYYYDPETKSITNSAAPKSNTSDTNLRKRPVARSTSITNESSSENSSVKKCDLRVSKAVQTAFVNNNQNIDDCKVLPDKNLDTAMSVQEKVNEYFCKRIILETESSGSSSSSVSKEKKLTNIQPVHCADNSEPQYEDDSDTLSSKSVSSNSSNVCAEKVAVNRRAYLEELCKVLNEDLDKMEEPRAPSVCSALSFESISSIGTPLSGDSALCRACGENPNPVNTQTQPCNHRYMCSDCAMRVFRLFKRCKVCRTKIERIVVTE